MRILAGLGFVVKSPVFHLLGSLCILVGYHAAAGPSLPRGNPAEDPCAACDVASSAGARQLRAASIESLGAAYAAHNAAIVLTADAHHFAGPADGVKDAEERARVFVQLRTWDGFRLVVDMTRDAQGFALSGDDALAPFRDRYPNAAVYPLRFVQGGFIGRGVLCLHYDMPPRHDEHVEPSHGGLRMIRRAIKIPGRGRVPVLLREFPLDDGDTIDLLFESRVCGRATTVRVEDRGDSLDIDVIHDLRGMYVQKYGVHALGALAVWRNVIQGTRPPLTPRFGACAYFPKLTLAMPLFLPDIGLDDLRDFGYPQPIMSKEWFGLPGPFLPSWIGATRPGVFSPWKAMGPRPRILAEWFPDL
ncbi:hypothetical protein JXA88_09070 [Candidatus Fermentibacteria bacterium]|nr:hypothetical protein [Candidatus Fermentibacteria bacterium]